MKKRHVRVFEYHFFHNFKKCEVKFDYYHYIIMHEYFKNKAALSQYRITILKFYA